MSLKTKLLSPNDLEDAPDCGQHRPPPCVPEHVPSAPAAGSDYFATPISEPNYFISAEDLRENSRQENLLRQHYHNTTTYHQHNYIYGKGPGPNVYVTVERERESVCCPLLLFILGFTFPVLWLFGCCYLSARTRRVRFLGRLSLCAFALGIMTSMIITFHFNARTGQWPWSDCFWNSQRC